MENLIKFAIMLFNFSMFCLGLMTFIIIVYKGMVHDDGVQFRNINSAKGNGRQTKK